MNKKWKAGERGKISYRVFPFLADDTVEIKEVNYHTRKGKRYGRLFVKTTNRGVFSEVEGWLDDTDVTHE